MASVGGSRAGEAREGLAPGVHSFMSRHTGSEAFKALFKEGMGLVELAAGYLDGPGRMQSKILPRPIALAYATESMRLTTRLMQIASWLLLRRAVAEGELTPQQALSEKHRVRLSRQEISCDPDTYGQLPEEFVRLCEKSMRLQERVIHLDQSNLNARLPRMDLGPNAVITHWARLHDAFPRPASA